MGFFIIANDSPLVFILFYIIILMFAVIKRNMRIIDIKIAQEKHRKYFPNTFDLNRL